MNELEPIIAPPHNHSRRDPILTMIAAFKFVQGVGLVGLGLGALQLIRLRDEANVIFDALGESVDLVWALKVLRDIGAIAPHSLRLVGGAMFVYAALFIVEGIGLWRQKRWAEYLTVIATASLIPFEIFEVARRVSVPRVAILVINVLVVSYLIWRIRHPLWVQLHPPEKGRVRAA